MLILSVVNVVPGLDNVKVRKIIVLHVMTEFGGV